MPMHVGGFDAAIARKNGYVVKTDSEGRQYSVKAGVRSSTVHPDGSVTSNCGTSYVNEYAIRNRAVELYTGYGVYGTVYHGYEQDAAETRRWARFPWLNPGFLVAQTGPPSCYRQ
ncbi:MAG: hypothetical protein M3Y35_07605 [Actinomycetota bacterium]|nr:hypothetical protein [Actinomycetota bacterium]